MLILGYVKPRTARYHHYHHLVFTDDGTIYRPSLKNLAFLYLFHSERLYLRYANGIKPSICHLQGRFSTGHLDTQIADIRPCTDRIRPRYQSAHYFALHLNQVAYSRKPGHCLEGAALELTGPTPFAALNYILD